MNCIISCMGGYNSRLSDKKTREGVYLCIAANTASERDVMYFLRPVTKKNRSRRSDALWPPSFFDLLR
ncbi:hypothetical protein KOSB73_80047 [Klebsiella grimontii]|uniref:Uncharacterized protein n=1 Tax=Klebsiella grimontii TaxID=2058152 RepID=A0A285BBH5_9ENTR|nr:hypothetical protein KOSB73_80047 [Klebsiella grimontii]